jgi:hypothetical protein
MTANLEARTVQDSETPATPIFAAPVRRPSAWTVADFRSPADYSVDLDAAQLRDIAAAMRRIKAAGIGLDGLQREHFKGPSLRPVVEEIRQQVEDGRGFVLLRRLPIEDYSKDDLGMICWGIGTHLGRGSRRASWATGSETSGISAARTRGRAPTATSRNCRRIRIRATWLVSCACATRRWAAVSPG